MRSLIFTLYFMPLAIIATLQPYSVHAQGIEPKTEVSAECKGETCASEAKSTQQSSSSSAAGEKKEEQADDIDVAKLLGVEELAWSWEQRIDGILTDLGLSTSFMGRVLASLAAITLALLLNYIVKSLINKLFRYLIKLKIRFHLNLQRLALYKRAITLFAQLLVLGLALSALAVVWQGGQRGFGIGEKIVGFLTSVSELAILFAVAVVLFEIATTAMEHCFRKWSAEGSARINTLLPIARNVTTGALVVIFGITILSELGIDVMPLLAGAGVIGIAIGFGAQTLVKDLLNGFIIIFEDLIQVGDVAGLGGKTGVVEKITIRKVQLRDLSGTVYTVPFGEITVVENLTKVFSFYVLNVGVAYRENPDEVIELLRKIGSELQADADFGKDIIEPIEILGVDQFADSAIIIKARIKTLPIKQWRVGREFNRRMKYAFDHHGIEIPFPHRTLYFGEGKDGTAPAAKLQWSESEATDKANSPTNS